MQEDSQVTYPDPGFWSKTSMIQLFYGVMVNLTSITSGLAYNFTAVLVRQLVDETPDESIPITNNNKSWIVNVLPLAILCGTLFGGFLMDTYGRRIVLSICQVPMAIGWILTGSARSAKDLIIGRLIIGIGVGMGMMPPRAYVTELALPNMRGLICSFPNLFSVIGITVQATLGTFLQWHQCAISNGVFSALLFCLSFIFPESPYFLLMKDTEEHTERALKKFRSKTYNISGEMEQMIEFKEDNNIRRLKFKDQMRLLFTKAACKPYWIIAVYVIFSQCSGINLIMMWSIEMFQETHADVHPAFGNVAMAYTRLFMTLLISTGMIKLGRRPLALLSSFGIFLTCYVLAFFLKNHGHTNPIPQMCYLIYILFASMGYYPLPILILFELSPLQIRGILGGLEIATVSIVMFIINRSYLSIEHILGFSNLILTFGTVSFFATIYIYFFLPETKGLTLQEIEEFYNERRPTLTSQRRIMSMQQLSRRTLNLESRSILKLRPSTKGL